MSANYVASPMPGSLWDLWHNIPKISPGKQHQRYCLPRKPQPGWLKSLSKEKWQKDLNLSLDGAEAQVATTLSSPSAQRETRVTAPELVSLRAGIWAPTVLESGFDFYHMFLVLEFNFVKASSWTWPAHCEIFSRS